MSGIEYGLGRFDDRRLEKGGPSCTRLWYIAAVRAFGGWPAIARAKCGLRVSCATTR